MGGTNTKEVQRLGAYFSVYIHTDSAKYSFGDVITGEVRANVSTPFQSSMIDIALTCDISTTVHYTTTTHTGSGKNRRETALVIVICLDVITSLYLVARLLCLLPEPLLL